MKISTVGRLIIGVSIATYLTAIPCRADMLKGRATVYSVKGTTAMGTQTEWGVCASGNQELIGKLVVIFQRLPDGTRGDAIGIYRVEDTGCKKEVIDIWCPIEYQQKIINKTYEKGCEGRIYIQIVEGEND